MKNVLFTLTMSTSPSWDGHWTGEGKNYTVVLGVSEDRIEELGLPQVFTHRWQDGWCAAVSARVVLETEKLQKSDGFSGYGWMVDNILRYGCTHSCPPCEWVPDQFEGYERCTKCQTSRKRNAQ